MLTPERLQALWARHADALGARVRNFTLRDGTAFEFDARAYLMGVINLSADSSHRESVCLTLEQAVERGRTLKREGASLVDLGAESTSPSAQPVGATEQRELLLPLIEQLGRLQVATSVETYRAEVAAACLERGAAVVNLTGLEESREIYRLAARHGAGVILCFVPGANAREVGALPLGEALFALQLDYFREQLEAATALGVERLWVDPGLGFSYPNLTDPAQRVAWQLEMLVQSFRLRALGWPVCHALPHAFAEPFFAAVARLGKTDLLRTHDVARVLPVVQALDER